VRDKGHGTRDIGFDRFFQAPNSFGEKFWRAHLLMRRKNFSVMLEGTSPDVPKIFGSA
jgi:hypothetical protein